ncbi:MAG: DUF1294 domain-containing protein [Chthoniobacter sp.]|nr:DUF1294 domain-containing protein [Chthoniobacter sp.]
MRRFSTADCLLLGLPAGFLCALALAILSSALSPWVGAGYAAASALTLGFYGWDKRHARREDWRIAESTLHLLELPGGWPGALVAQRLFRHKTRKIPFQIVFWLIVTGHLAAWGWWMSQQI